MHDDSLAAEIDLEALDHDELVTTLSSLFTQGEWRGDNEVIYREPDKDPGLTLVYRKSRLVDVRRGPALNDALLAELQRRLANLQRDDGATIVWRDVLFSDLPLTEGYWRYGDDWQIVPAPPAAPRAAFAIAQHPFVIEIRLRRHGDDLRLQAQARACRAWELHLILSLVLRGRIHRYGERAHHLWALVGDRAEYVQTGFFIPDWLRQSDDFTRVQDMPTLREVPDAEYTSHRGISTEDVFEVPDVLRPLLDRYHAVDPRLRDVFLKACYWYERSGAAWDMSVSLGHIAAVNAVESLMPAEEVDRCPTCGLNRAPGTTRRFIAFVDRHAAAVPDDDRSQIYVLRSALVHGGRLLDIDTPGPWGALIPGDLVQRGTYGAARQVARAVIVNWLLDQPGSNSGELAQKA